MKKLLTLIVCCTFFNFGYSQNPDAAFEKGNALYQEKKYEEALESYSTIADAGLESAALYYNMGNAYFKTDQLAKAILHYERAARLAPNDDDIRQNLNLAKEATIDRFETMPEPIIKTAYHGIFKAMQPGSWGVMAIVFLGLMLVGTYLYLYTSLRRQGFAFGLTTLILGVLSLWLGYAHYNHLKNNQPAIVMAKSSYVKSGPGEKAEDVFILHEGTKALVTESYDNWKKIKLPDGKIGWIEAADIQEI